jgi:hypothetical protein
LREVNALRYPRISDGPNGVSHFDEVELELEPVEYVPGHPRMDLAAAGAASAILFIRLPGGAHLEWHRSPRAQFSITLAGEVEVTTGDGERRRFGPGSVYLSADTTGRGHDTRVISPDAWLVAVVPLAEQGGAATA